MPPSLLRLPPPFLPLMRLPEGTARVVLVVLVGALLALLGPALAAPAAAAPAWGWPVGGSPSVTRPFALGPTAYSPGHRGVDLSARPGAAVLAAGAGVVGYAGRLAGRGVVVVVHGALRTTYEPVDAQVKVGQLVLRGQRLGSLAEGHRGCPAAACLHWGLRRGLDYLDPLRLVGAGRVRLLPWASTAGARTWSAPAAVGDGGGAVPEAATGAVVHPAPGDALAGPMAGGAVARGSAPDDAQATPAGRPAGPSPAPRAPVAGADGGTSTDRGPAALTAAVAAAAGVGLAGRARRRP